MKSKLPIIIVCITMLFSCSKETDQDLFQKTTSKEILSSREEPIPGNEFCTQVDLIAGQNYDSGNIEIALDGDNLLVTYTMEGDWTMGASHLYAGECSERPTNRAGNPIIGQFPFAATHAQGTTTYTYSIPLDTLPNCMCIAAHAEVHGPSGSETAWGEGLPYGGNNWAMYFEFCVDQCGL